MRERTDEQPTTPNDPPEPQIHEATRRRVDPATSQRGANSECYARTTPSHRWGQNREEQWGQFRVLQPLTASGSEAVRSWED